MLKFEKPARKKRKKGKRKTDQKVRRKFIDAICAMWAVLIKHNDADQSLDNQY